jgi:predicted ABC-type ATPase
LANTSGRGIDGFSLREEIQRRISSNVAQHKSFGIESNVVNNHNYEIVHEVSSKNYQTVLYFIGAENLEILNSRIRQRVLLGHHYVSPEDVRERYRSALQKLPSNLKLFDRAIFLDNSIQNAPPVEVLHLEKGVIKWRLAYTPEWLFQILPIIEKLSAAYQKIKSNL